MFRIIRRSSIPVLLFFAATLNAQDSSTESLSLDSLFSVTDENSEQEENRTLYLPGSVPFPLMNIDHLKIVPDAPTPLEQEVDVMLENVDRSKLRPLAGWSGAQRVERKTLSLQEIKNPESLMEDGKAVVEVLNELKELEIEFTLIPETQENAHSIKLHSGYNDQIIVKAGTYQPELKVWSRENPGTLLILEFEEMEFREKQQFRLKLDDQWETINIRKLREQASRNQSVSIESK